MHNLKSLACPNCLQNYDLDHYLPRLFTTCGHSFCSDCISTLVDLQQQQVHCFIDGQEEQFYQIDKGVESFPVNQAIVGVLREKIELDKQYHSQSNMSKYDENTCQEHGKVIDLVCIGDYQPICADCVLFGQHKDHKCVQNSQFIGSCGNDLKKLMSQIKKFQEQKGTITGENVFANFKRNLQNLQLNTKKIFLEIQKLFQSFQKDILNSIQTISKEIDNDQKLQLQQCEVLDNSIEKFSQSINDMKNLLLTQPPKVNQILTQFYGSHSIFNEQRSIQQEINKQKENIDKTKKKYQDYKIDLNVKDFQTKFLNLFSKFQQQHQIIAKKDKKIQKKRSKDSHDFLIDQDLSEEDNDSNTSLRLKEIRRKYSVKPNKNTFHRIKITPEVSPERNKKNVFESESATEKNSSFHKKHTRPTSQFHLNVPNKSMFSSRLMPVSQLQTPQRNTHGFGQSLILNDYSRRNTVTEHRILDQLNVSRIEDPKKKIFDLENTRKMRSRTNIVNIYKKDKSGKKKKEINFSKSQINDKNIDQFLSKIQSNKNIKSLNLSQNGLTSKGVQYLLKTLVQNSKIEEIDLSQNFIKDDIFRVIQRMGHRISKLKLLNLSQNKINIKNKQNQMIVNKFKLKGLKILIANQFIFFQFIVQIFNNEQFLSQFRVKLKEQKNPTQIYQKLIEIPSATKSIKKSTKSILLRFIPKVGLSSICQRSKVKESYSQQFRNSN